MVEREAYFTIILATSLVVKLARMHFTDEVNGSTFYGVCG